MKISETEEKRMIEDNEKRVRAFYEATVFCSAEIQVS